MMRPVKQARVHGFGHQDVYIVTELCTGGDLHSCLTQAPALNQRSRGFGLRRVESFKSTVDF